MQVIPYFNFPGQAEDALAFCAAAGLGTVTNISRFGDMASPHGNATPDQIMHGRITSPDGVDVVMASDGGRGGEMLRCARSIAIADSTKAHALFAALSEGGEVSMPMPRQFWGAQFGMFKDKLVVEWMVNCEEPAV